MEIILRVEQGPDRGREFRFKSGDNFLIGRKDVTSKAHYNLSPNDRYVSRHHFTIEVRPPNCLIRDNQSLGGTFICRKGQQDWERIEEAMVYDGDRIRVGHTILSVTVVAEEPEGVPTLPSQPAPPPLMVDEDGCEPELEPGSRPEYMCIRCGRLLEEVPSLRDSMRATDFMCPPCREQAEAQLAQEAAAYQALEAQCVNCGCDMTHMADRDGRAAELAEVALYLCEECAEQATEKRRENVGDYRVLSELGRGGMGIVYKTWHTETGRLAAIKQMLPMARAHRELVLRFMREMSIMEDLRHGELVRLYETGQHGGVPHFVSEFVPDGNLAQFVSPDGRPQLPPADATLLIIEALEPLAFMHEKGYVHRDIKPENILLRRVNGTLIPKLADFGLARSYERHGGTISRTGNFSGTIMYMPQEQILMFKHCKPTVDIYAMGVTLYFLLTGRFSLDLPPLWELRRGVRPRKDPIRMVLEDTPKPIASRRKDLPLALCEVVDRAAAKEAADRYQTAREFQAALRNAIGV